MALPTFPVSDAIQFVPGAGTFVVERFVDPSGTPVDVVDIDVGFTVSGRIELPGWLSGQKLVRLAADQIGGPFDGSIGQQTVNITGSTSPTDPRIMRYDWSITVMSPTLPDRDEMYQPAVLFDFQSPTRANFEMGNI